MAHFGAASFGKEGVDFSATKFSQRATFDEAKSAGYVNFRRARFIGEASFMSSKLRGLVAFNDAQFTTFADFKDSTFESVPTFHGANLHEDTTFEGVAWPEHPHKSQSPYDATRAWARLRVEMNRLHKHEDELFFFAKELKARAHDRRNEPLAWNTDCVCCSPGPAASHETRRYLFGAVGRGPRKGGRQGRGAECCVG